MLLAMILMKINVNLERRKKRSLSKIEEKKKSLFKNMEHIFRAKKTMGLFKNIQLILGEKDNSRKNIRADG